MTAIPPKSVTFLLPYAGNSGGVRVIAEHAGRLAQRGWRVVVVSQPRWKPDLSMRLRKLARGRWMRSEPAVRESFFDGLPLEHRALPKPRRVKASDVPDADVLVSTWWETALWAHELPSSKGRKVSFIQGYEAHSDEMARRIDEAWRLPAQKIVVSRWLQRLALDRFGDDSARLALNGVDTERFHAPARGKQPVPTVGFVYSRAHCKGADVMIEAVRRARREIPELRLVVFGSDRPTSALALPAPFSFRELPRQSELRELYASCDAWLFGSRAEGFGLPILEAMACRTPVIAAPAGAAPELMERGGGALLQEADPEEMAHQIVRLGSLSEAEWRAVSDRALETAQAHPWERSSEAFERILLGESEATRASLERELSTGRRSA